MLTKKVRRKVLTIAKTPTDRENFILNSSSDIINHLHSRYKLIYDDVVPVKYTCKSKVVVHPPSHQLSICPLGFTWL